MKLKILTFYIPEYVFVFPLYYLHELSHWFVAWIFYIAGTNYVIPKITIERLYSVKVISHNATSSMSHHMSITTGVHNRNYLTSIFITSAPAIMTVMLFIISPWWLCLIYCNNLSTLWLSVGDITYLIHVYTKVKRANNIKKLKLTKTNNICLKS